MPQLQNVRHEAFARVFAETMSTEKAVVACGYSERGSLLNRSDVAERIRELKMISLQASDITAERVMLELARIAFADPRKMFDANGDLIPVTLLDADTAAGIAGIEVEDKVIGRGENAIPVRTRKIKRVDKNPALAILAKHFRIVGDEGDGLSAIAAALSDRLRTARRRTIVVDSSEEVEEVEGVPAEPPALEDERLW